MSAYDVRSLGWDDPPEEAMAPTPVLLPGKSHGQRRLVSYSPWGRKESDMTFIIRGPIFSYSTLCRLKYVALWVA